MPEVEEEHGRTDGQCPGDASPLSGEARVRAAESEQLDDWSERFVDAQTLADVFGPDELLRRPDGRTA